MKKQGNPLMLCALRHGHLDCTCSGITSGVRPAGGFGRVGPPLAATRPHSRLAQPAAHSLVRRRSSREGWSKQ
jgi:hypothetical protein